MKAKQSTKDGMEKSGVFAVARGVFDHPVFADEPFSEREAWIWLVGEAAWKPTRARVGRAVVHLARGDLAHSTRFMATKWKWSEARVRRFLARLKDDAMIVVKTDALATQITVCNYDAYQKVGMPDDAEATQKRRTADAEKKQGNIEEDTSSLRSDVPRAPSDELAVVLDPEHVDAVLAHRKAMRAPLTGKAAQLLAKSLAGCRDPNAAADLMILKGWRSIKPEWEANEARQTGPPRQRSQNGYASVAVETMQDIANDQPRQGSHDWFASASGTNAGTAPPHCGPDQRGDAGGWPDGSSPRQGAFAGGAARHGGPVIDLEVEPRPARPEGH